MPEFDEAYVKKLREENAAWRNKVRELEAQSAQKDIVVELERQGITADPSWVQMEEGESVQDAVAKLGETYPHLKVADIVESSLDFEPELPKRGPGRPTPRPVAPSTPNSTSRKPAQATRITRRNIAEIRKDPKARAKVRDFYRGLLAQSYGDEY